MKWFFQETTQPLFNFEKDLLAGQLFLIIKNNFVKKLEDIIPQKIIEIKKKNKSRILDNLFCHWYFWEAYTNENISKYPLLLKKKFNYQSLKNILNNYFKNDDNKVDLEKVINNLNLEDKFSNAVKYLDNNNLSVSFKKKYMGRITKITIKTSIQENEFDVSSRVFEKLKNKLKLEKTVALLFRYYVLSSNNNQLAINSKLFNKLNVDLELFSSGFNNYCDNFCSMFPDLEKDLGSVGRFQDIDILEGSYQINPPFQTTIIYDVLNKIKLWIDKANSNNKKLEFHLFLPNWLKNNDLKYDNYLVLELCDKINGSVSINKINNNDFNYIDYWNNKIKNETLPDTLYLIIKN